jgi:signal peptidase II
VNSKFARYAGLAFLIVLVDQVTKTWAVNALDDGRIIHVIWTLQFALGFNSGMAFSQGEGLGPVIGVIALIAVVVLLISLRRTGSTMSSIGVALVCGGAAGNVVDRLFRGDGWLHGAVVDFIDLQWWPVFNIADAAITVGAVLLLVSTFISEFRDSRSADEISTESP